MRAVSSKTGLIINALVTSAGMLDALAEAPARGLLLFVVVGLGLAVGQAWGVLVAVMDAVAL